MKLTDLKNKRITVMGLGIHGGGLSAAKTLAQAKAKVLVTDIKKKEDLKSSLDELKGLDIKYVLGQHRPEDFIETDMVIKNPAVSNESTYLKLAKDHGVPIETDVSLFLRMCPADIIGVTGTKGKSTTASLIYEIFKQAKKTVYLAGTVSSGILGILPKLKKKDVVVMELSSWQLESLESHKISPHIAVITNIFPDHLNTYKNFDEYVKAKLNISNFQKGNDKLILNYKNKILKELFGNSKNSIMWANYSGKFPAPSNQTIGCFTQDKGIYFGVPPAFILEISKIPLWGKHNLTNVMLAINSALIYKLPVSAIQNAIKSFKPLEGRLEIVSRHDGDLYINDTTATSPGAVTASLKAVMKHFPNKNVILIAGGVNKKLSYSDLTAFLNESGQIRKVLLLPGSASDEIKSELDRKKLEEMESMKEAVKIASKEEGDNIVILSPGAASFNLFVDEFDRGKEFKKNVLNLNNK